MRTVIKLIASGLYTGYSPIAPGTVGSLLGVLIFLQMQGFFLGYLLITLLLIILGFLVAGKAEEIYKKKDSRKIVIDEIAGMCIVFLGMPSKLWIIIPGFFIYRILDVIKPPPIRKIEELKGSAGVMLDDIACAIYTNIFLQVLTRLFLP